ncbi:aldo/keto reductase [Nocardia huaxiensis]|uniref:Aldo/keto reductase n=1 Tax=Nocardia huaxiensis TaxID=2755382 RepID=A0A7D6ZM47_9NOCA|nr:aldo/keto reductase [Nocardia huaxiensis]QLY33907.1 aldo/keto reductase [Nocardia huaxiensis]
MQEVTLNNGSTVPQLGFGVWQVEDDQAYSAVTTAFEAGYRHIDTARIYENETGVGRAIRDSGLPRGEVFLTTKLWNSDQGYDAALTAFDASLDRLGTDYVDLYLIHWPTPEHDRYVDTWRALEKIYADGRAKAIGVSNFTEATLKRLVDETDIVPVLNQIELHPYFQQREMRSVAGSLGIATEAWSPLGQGGALLSEPVLARLAEQYGKTPAQIVLRWHLQIGNIVIPKSVTPSRISENIDVFDFALSEADLALIDDLDNPGGRIGPNPDTFNLA